MLKKLVNETESPTTANNSIYSHLTQVFSNLENNSNPNKDSLFLPIHKKKAVLITLAKLYIATFNAYSETVIKKASMLNSQIDLIHQLVPSIQNCLNTYSGDIRETYLEKQDKIVATLFEEVHTNGMVSKETFNSLEVPPDMNNFGMVVRRDFDIRNENCQ